MRHTSIVQVHPGVCIARKPQTDPKHHTWRCDFARHKWQCGHLDDAACFNRLPVGAITQIVPSCPCPVARQSFRIGRRGCAQRLFWGRNFTTARRVHRSCAHCTGNRRGAYRGRLWRIRGRGADRYPHRKAKRPCQPRKRLRNSGHKIRTLCLRTGVKKLNDR